MPDEQISDDAGNELFRSDNSGEIFLKLSGRDEVRKLGFMRGRVFFTRRKHSNTMRTLNEIGFSSLLIHRGNFDLIRVQLSSGRELQIEREKVLELGTYKWFARSGFERQVFVPVHAFTEVPIGPYRKRKTIGNKNRLRRCAKPVEYFVEKLPDASD
jgi:hypothetical protein